MALSQSALRGISVKIARLLLIVAFFGICCSVARADGTDPKVFTSGCGGKGQPACDADFLTPSNPTQVSVTFTFLAADDPSNPDPGQVAAFDDIVNWTGMNIGRFVLNLAANDSNGDALTYACGGNNLNGAFNCSQLGADSFLFDGGTLCSVPQADNPQDAQTAFAWISAPPAPCQIGERFFLEASLPGDPTNLVGKSVTATIFAPEPSSALLLLIGFAAGAFVIRKRSLHLA
jgi:hypothetical protein